MSVPPGASAASAMPRAGWMERTLSRPAAWSSVVGGQPAGHRRVGAAVAGVVDLHADAAQLGGRRRRGAGDVDADQHLAALDAGHAEHPDAGDTRGRAGVDEVTGLPCAAAVARTLSPLASLSAAGVLPSAAPSPPPPGSAEATPPAARMTALMVTAVATIRDFMGERNPLTSAAGDPTRGFCQVGPVRRPGSPRRPRRRPARGTPCAGPRRSPSAARRPARPTRRRPR